jgi:hypothetical protein
MMGDLSARGLPSWLVLLLMLAIPLLPHSQVSVAMMLAGDC